MQDNKYRGVVQQTLIDKTITEFMSNNCKGPFSDAQFRFTVKARPQYLMTNFMRKLIFGEGNGVCNLCQKDRQNKVYHILNGCNLIAGDYITRHNLIVKGISEAIKLNCNVIGTVHENLTVVITTSESKPEQSYRTRIRPDICSWTEKLTEDLIPEKQRILHLVEVKSCWGEVDGETLNREGGSTIDECRRKAWRKYKDAIILLQPNVKDTIDHGRVIIEPHIIAVSSLGAFDKDSTHQLSEILETKTKKIIHIWRKRLVVAALKGSFNI
jgi:hypothetical protein